MMITCLIGVAVSIASTGVLGSAACTDAIRAKADAAAAVAPAAIFVRQVLVKCESIRSSLSDVSPQGRLGVKDDTGGSAFSPRRESFVTRSAGTRQPTLRLSHL